MKHLYLTTALALVASPTLADITPEELWQSWQETNSHFGMGLSAASQTREGAVLVLQDVASTINFGFFEVEQVFAQMRLEALNDGSVSVSYNTSMTATLSIDLPDTPSPNVTMTGQFEGTEGIVTGTANDYIYDFIIARTQIDGTVTMGEESGVQSTSSSSAISTGLNGRIHYASSEAGINVAYTFSLESVNNAQDTSNTIGGEAGNFKQSQRTVAEGYSGEVSFFSPTANPDTISGSLLPEGFTLNADLSIEHVNVRQKTASPYFNSDVEVDQQNADISVTVDGQNIGFSTRGQETYISVALPELGPQPYRTDFANASFALSLPYRPSDTPQNAQFALSLGGVRVSENIWALADPENTLSRAPADFAISTQLSTTLLLDWTNIEAVKAWEGAPALLHKAVLESFAVGFENAKLEGEGAVDFSNETDVPMPNGGALSFTLTGIPALLEKLSGLPLVNPAIIAQANGMLGIFTSAGEGGTLVSEVEFGEDGAITVNGQRVK